jgi:hypothetical protein
MEDVKEDEEEEEAGSLLALYVMGYSIISLVRT